MGKIYCIQNKVNGKRYIGKTTSTLYKRFYKHCYDSKHNPKTYLHKAIAKHGKECFEIYLVEETDNINTREQFWIRELNTLAPIGYNLTKGGDGGDTSSTEGYINGMKRRRSYKGKGNPMYGKSAMKGLKHSESTKLKMSEARRKYWENLDRNTFKCKTSGSNNPMYGKVPLNAKPVKIDNVEYSSIAGAARELGISEHKVRKYVKAQQD